MLNTEKYGIIIKREMQLDIYIKKHKYNKKGSVGWHCFISDVPEMEVLKAQSPREYHPSSEHL